MLGNLLKLVLPTVGGRSGGLGVARFAEVRRHEVPVAESPRGAAGDGVPCRPDHGRRRLAATVRRGGRVRSPTDGQRRRVQKRGRRRRLELADRAACRCRQLMTCGVHVHPVTARATLDEFWIALLLLLPGCDA